MFDAVKTKNECVKWIREFFKENGDGCNAVIGISGGKDSSVTAALCVEALGKDRVIGVLMPNGEQHDIDMAKLLVSHLGIKHYIVNIKDSVDGIISNLPFELSKQSRENIPPRIRKVVSSPKRKIPTIPNKPYRTEMVNPTKRVTKVETLPTLSSPSPPTANCGRVVSRRTANQVTATEIKKAMPNAPNANLAVTCPLTHITIAVTRIDSVETNI